MKPAFRYSMIIRQWRLLVRLADYRRGVTLECLREAISELTGDPVSERTLRRDLEALMLAGFSITHGRDHGGAFWKLDDAEIVQRLASRRINHQVLDAEDRPDPVKWLPLGHRREETMERVR